MNEAKKERRTKEELLAIIEGFEAQQRATPDEFPQEGNRWETDETAYKAQVSPITRDVAKPTHTTWMRDKWYDIPVIEVPEGLGIPSKEHRRFKDRPGLFTLYGAQALRYMFLARAAKEFGNFVRFNTRIVRVDIKATYKETITSCVDEESS